MAKHGHEKSLKRINATSKIVLPKKDKVWFAKPSPGKHKGKESISLLSFLRDLLDVANNARESKLLIKNGKVLVDGSVVKDPKFAISFMDVIYIPDIDVAYRMELDERGRLVPKRINAKHKYLQVTGKRSVPGSKIQISLSDGRTMLSKEGYKVGDTLKLSLPEFKVLGHYPFKEGARCVVLAGKHAGGHGKIATIFPGTATARSKVYVETDDGQKFVIVKDYVFVEGGE